MKRIDLKLDENMGIIGNAIKDCVYLTTKAGNKVNSMAIEWGTVGNLWGKPVFICYVRQSRFTREQLDINPEFTINIPVGKYDKRIMALCGSKSGRDIDKVKDAGFTLVDSDKISVPGIKELPLTIECKVIYRQEQDIDLIPEDIRKRFYPKSKNGEYDTHITYIGEIVNLYKIED